MDTTGESESDYYEDNEISMPRDPSCKLGMNPLVGEDYFECPGECGAVGHVLCFQLDGCPQECNVSY
jgi:hypothetical protein